MSWCSASSTSADDLAQVPQVHAGGECCRTNQVREHHRDLATLSGVLCRPVDGWKGAGWRRFRVSTQGSDGVEHLTAVADNNDAKVLQVLRTVSSVALPRNAGSKKSWWQ